MWLTWDRRFFLFHPLLPCLLQQGRWQICCEGLLPSQSCRIPRNLSGKFLTGLLLWEEDDAIFLSELKGACPEQDIFCLVCIQLEVTLSDLSPSMKTKCSSLADFVLSCQRVHGLNSHTLLVLIASAESSTLLLIFYKAASITQVNYASLMSPGYITIRVITS